MIVLKAVKPPKSIPDSAISTQLQMAAGLFTTAWESCIQIMNDETFDSKCIAAHLFLANFDESYTKRNFRICSFEILSCSINISRNNRTAVHSVYQLHCKRPRFVYYSVGKLYSN